MEASKEQNPIEKAWEIYHGPINLEDGEEPYLPPPPPSFARGFVDGVEHLREKWENRGVLKDRETPVTDREWESSNNNNAGAWRLARQFERERDFLLSILS